MTHDQGQMVSKFQGKGIKGLPPVTGQQAGSVVREVARLHGFIGLDGDLGVEGVPGHLLTRAGCHGPVGGDVEHGRLGPAPDGDGGDVTHVRAARVIHDLLIMIWK